jgi:hypothetical protein
MSKYEVIKERGNNGQVTIINTDTKASINIGRLTLEIINTLREQEGISFEEDTKDTLHLELKDAWKIEVKDEVGKKLASFASKIHSPKKTKTSSGNTEQSSPKIKIDALDVLLGRASYNKNNINNINNKGVK